MNPSMNYQTDLEVILEFLEEHCRQETRGLWDNADLHTNQQSIGDNYGILSAKSQPATGKEMGFDSAGLRHTVIQGLSMEETLNAPSLEERVSGQHTSLGEKDESSSTPAGRGEMVCLHPSTPCESAKKTHQSLYIVPGKKLRLFHFLFEMLEDPGMAHCLSWVPASVGVFRFSSTYKEHVAALWGQRKGNRRPMTYQKMSRALRNYTRSGEIIKVRKN